MVPAAFSALDASPMPDGCATVLRLLAASSPNWPEVALVAARDPVLCLALLSASPLANGELDEGLNAVLRRRLERLGPDLLRAWLLGAVHAPAVAGGDSLALLRGECALHLALETRYPRPDEAYLGGLWQHLAELASSLDTRGGSCDTPPKDPDQRPEFTRIVRACGLSEALCDALALGTLLSEQLRGAHPLVRVLHAARLLAADDWQARTTEVAELTGLGSASIVSLRTDVAYIVSGHAVYPPPPGGEAALAIAADNPFREAAISGLLNAAFADLEAAGVADRLAIGAAFFGIAAEPILLAADDAGRLRSLLPAARNGTSTLIDELDLSLDDERSCIAMAARSGELTTHDWAGARPHRSMTDWHVARWLGQQAFPCLPLPAAGHTAIAVLPGAAARSGARLRGLSAALLGAGARAIRAAQRRENDAATREAALQQRFREHVRKIAHEATNPLTVVKNRLELLGQQRADDTPLQDEMLLLNAELDRIDNLLRRASDLPVESAEAPSCRVTELLLEMRAVYGEALFAQHGIGFELRAARNVPDAAIPASALKQVLLNLLRNASEALQPGRRVTVSVMGTVILDGRAQVEIRVADNGPGLPADRLADLFSPRPSSKGGGHQGLGLSVVRDILAQSKASIMCRSQPGIGTSFQILVPLDQSGAVLHHVTESRS